MPDVQPRRRAPQPGEIWLYTRRRGSGPDTHSVHEVCSILEADHGTVWYVTRRQQRQMPLVDFLDWASKDPT